MMTRYQPVPKTNSGIGLWGPNQCRGNVSGCPALSILQSQPSHNSKFKERRHFETKSHQNDNYLFEKLLKQKKLTFTASKQLRIGPFDMYVNLRVEEKDQQLSFLFYLFLAFSLTFYK